MFRRGLLGFDDHLMNELPRAVCRACINSSNILERGEVLLLVGVLPFPTSPKQDVSRVSYCPGRLYFIIRGRTLKLNKAPATDYDARTTGSTRAPWIARASSLRCFGCSFSSDTHSSAFPAARFIALRAAALLRPFIPRHTVWSCDSRYQANGPVVDVVAVRSTTGIRYIKDINREGKKG